MCRLLLRCPLCGAQIESLEEEHVVRCAFCSSKLLASVRGGPPAYAFSPKLQETQRIRSMLAEQLRREGTGPGGLSAVELTHLPFWRLQAVSYRWVFGSKSMGKPEPTDLFPPPSEKVRELVVRPLDHTMTASPGCGLGMETLGVRTQVLPLKPVAPGEIRESCLPVEVSKAEAMEALRQLARVSPQPQGVSQEMVLESLVGVRLTLLFFPVWKGTVRVGEAQRHFFLDGLEGRLLGKSLSEPPGIEHKGQSSKGIYLGELKLLPFRCPDCGWDLPFRPSSLLHLCPTCLRLWAGHEGGWRQVRYEVAAPPQGQAWENLLWVPFWCMRCRFSDGKKTLQKASELRRLAPQATAPASGSAEEAPATLYVPAIRFPDPKVSMALAVKLTGAQPRVQISSFPSGLKINSAGASLPAQDAARMALPVLGGLVPFRNREILQWLGGVRAQVEQAGVRFMPFSRKDIFWMELHTRATFPHNPRCADLADGKL